MPTPRESMPSDAILRRHPVAWFFVLAFGVSWLIALPEVIAEWRHTSNPLHAVFGLKQWFGPALAGVVMTWAVGGRAGLAALWHRMIRVRAHWRWYLFALLGPIVFLLAGMLIAAGVPAHPSITSRMIIGYPVYLLALLLFTGLPEETGWRGFALPRLQDRFGPLPASLLLGALWGVWHWPFFLLREHGGGPGTDAGRTLLSLAVFTVAATLLAVPFTYLHNSTRASVFMVALLHAAIDAPQVVWASQFIPGLDGEPTQHAEFLGDLALLVAAALACLVIVPITRGRLGYSERRPATAEDVANVPV